ncbi:MAG: hypothetical protein M3422_11360 [Actinomycetota bacterium]|nr:hypothetical protein [Actinomycetota bacterium]
MDKQLFDDAIGEVPPSTVDVEAAIARGRRAARFHRVANPAVAAGVAVVLLTGAVAYTVTRGGDGGTTVGAAPPATSSSTTTPTSTGPTSTAPSTPAPPTMTSEVDDAVPPPQCEENDLETAAEAAARLTQATTKAVTAQRTGMTLLVNPAGDYPVGTSHGPLEYHQVSQQGASGELSICDPRAVFEAAATTQTADGKGNILVVMGPAMFDSLGIRCDDSTFGERTYCEATTGPRGEEVVKQTLELEGGTTQHRVEVLRKDGTEVLVQAENIATTSKGGGAPTATKPPLTHDQLAAIATDPALTLFP